MRFTSLFFVALLTITTAYGITNFIVDGNSETEFSYPPDGRAYIEIPRLYCAIGAQMNISGEPSDAEGDDYPQPQIGIGIGVDEEYGFRAVSDLDQEVQWINDWCDPLLSECENLVTEINRYLSHCNEEQEGDDPCMVPVRIENQNDAGNTRVHSLSVNAIEAYSGPVFGGDGYTCDLDVMCEEGPDADACLIGEPADAIMVLQYSQSMRNNCDFVNDDDVESDCDDTDFITRSLARDTASTAFVHEFFDFSEGNAMGVLPLLATIPPGQEEELTYDRDTILEIIERGLGESLNFCFSCSINRSAEILIEDGRHDAVKSILLMSDGEPSFCLQDGYGQTCQNGPYASREENARDESINEACRVYEEYGIKINTVAYGSDADTETLQAIADCADGRMFSGNSLTGLIEFYESVAQDVSGDCEGFCEFVNEPFEPDSFCGDGVVDEGEDCDWGTANRDYCAPDEGEFCLVCTNSCELKIVQDDVDDERDPEEPGEGGTGYCGDGIVQAPNRDEIYEECDFGSDVNTNTPCTPLPGGSCTICNLQCELKTFSSPHPPVRECFEVETSASYPNEIFLNDYVSALGVDSLFELEWTLHSSDPGMDPVIIANNVLRVEGSGYVIVDVTDGTDEDQGCFEFRSATAEYGMSEPPLTRLLIRQGRVVSGYIERPLSGEIETWGPYRVTAEVWQR